MKAGPQPSESRKSSAFPLPVALATLLSAAATTAFAGGSSESALLIVDPSSAEARYVANYYRNARQVPAANVLYMDPHATSYPAFVDDNQDGFLGTLAGRRIEHVDYVVVMPGTGFYVSAPGLVSDGCSPVNRFGIASPFTLAFNSSTILNGVPSSRLNRYYGLDDQPLAFDSSTSWFGGEPSEAGNAERYFIGAMLGYTGERGNTIPQILDLIDRSVAIDGTHPAGTFYFMETNDPIRSGPRDGAYPLVSSAIDALGGDGEHLLANMPEGFDDCQGVMTGLANPVIENGNFTLLPGSFGDHLTSYAGTFDNSSQTKMSEWITKGASGTCGTVEEPCNYAGKFPHARLHLWYFQGLSLGEAWFRSVRYYPFQNLLYGDPLTRPFATIPDVDVPDAPGGVVVGTILLTPTASGPLPVEGVELYVDGVLTRTGTLGDSLPLQTEILADGWHELRVLAYDSTPARNVGRWIGAVLVDNQGASATLAASATSGSLETPFDFTLEAPGQTPVELRLVAAGRVLAATTDNPGTVRVHGHDLGAGPVLVHTEALLAAGQRVRSAPLALAIDFVDNGPAGPPPVAFSYTKRVPADQATVVELPSASDEDPALATFTVVTPPAQASLAPGATGGFRILRPDPGASGTDALVFRVDTPSGTSAEATVTLVYEPPIDCPQPLNYCIGAPNSSGPGATILYSGSTSVAQNEIVLQAFGATPNQFGIFYYGPDQVQLPFGDGFRCVGAGAVGTFRLPVVNADSFGDVLFELDLNTPPMSAGSGQIEPGDAWNFQFWYRDPGGPGGTGFNFSDAVEATFCP